MEEMEEMKKEKEKETQEQEIEVKQIVYSLSVYLVMYDKDKHPYFAELDYEDAMKFPDNPEDFKNKLFDACQTVANEYEKFYNKKIVSWKYVRKSVYEEIMKKCEMNSYKFPFGGEE